MTDNEFNALVRLLEDDDPEVSNHVETRLVEMGGDAIPRLEHAWEVVADQVIQERLEEIIHVIQSVDTLEELRAWHEGDGRDLLRAWFLISRYQFPNIAYVLYKNKVNRLVNKIWLDIRRDMNVAEKLMTVNRMLFTNEEFQANKRSLSNPANYFMHTFFEKKKGTPITLGLLYMNICQQLDIPIYGIVLPNYFVLYYKDHYNEFYIDVFNKGAFFVQKDLTAFIKKMKLADNPKYYQPSTHASIMVHFVQTLIHAFNTRKEADKVKKFEKLLKEINS